MFFYDCNLEIQRFSKIHVFNSIPLQLMCVNNFVKLPNEDDLVLIRHSNNKHGLFVTYLLVAHY